MSGIVKVEELRPIAGRTASNLDNQARYNKLPPRDTTVFCLTRVSIHRHPVARLIPSISDDLCIFNDPTETHTYTYDSANETKGFERFGTTIQSDDRLLLSNIKTNYLCFRFSNFTFINSCKNIETKAMHKRKFTRERTRETCSRINNMNNGSEVRTKQRTPTCILY